MPSLKIHNFILFRTNWHDHQMWWNALNMKKYDFGCNIIIAWFNSTRLLPYCCETTILYDNYWRIKFQNIVCYFMQIFIDKLAFHYVLNTVAVCLIWTINGQPFIKHPSSQKMGLITNKQTILTPANGVFAYDVTLSTGIFWLVWTRV